MPTHKGDFGAGRNCRNQKKRAEKEGPPNIAAGARRKENLAEKIERRSRVMVNRAPVLTLWAAVVAEVLGFEHDEALTLGRAMAGGESKTMLARLSSLLSL